MRQRNSKLHSDVNLFSIMNSFIKRYNFVIADNYVFLSPLTTLKKKLFLQKDADDYVDNQKS